MKKLLSLTAAIVFVLTNATLVSAEDPRLKREDLIKQRQQTLKEQQETIQKQLNEKQEVNWEKIRENLGNRMTKWEESREKGQKRYINAAERVSKSIEKFKAKGMDTTELEAMLKEYNRLVAEGFNSMGNGLNALEQAEKAADVKNLGALVSSLATVNTEVKNGKESYTEAKAYFKEKVAPEMKELIKEYKSKS